jgi:WD40 repeat protein
MHALRYVVVPLGIAALAAGCDESSPPAPGDLRVVATTSGEDGDPDGYTLTIDDEELGPLGPDGEMVVTGLLAGEHDVGISGLASNCTTAENPRTTSIVGGDIVTETFDVECDERVGAIEVTTTTTGSSIDADGYLVRVGDGTPVAVAANGSVTLSGIAEGAAMVTLFGQAGNCTVSQGVVSAVVGFGTTTEVEFEIACTPAGTLRTSVATAGAHAPANGYRFVMLWYAAPMHESRVLAPTDAVEWALPAGEWSVSLQGLSPNCTVEGGHLRTVTLAVEQVVDVAYAVHCAAPGLVAFTALGDETGGSDIYTVATNGTGLRRLTTDVASDAQPDWSPDGAKIAFTSWRGGNPGIYVMNADGSGQTRLSDAAIESEPDWSPDGSRIAFTRRDGDLADIWIMDATGENAVRVTSDPAVESEPAWSPDGTRIAFIRANGDGSSRLYVMNADGSGIQPRTDENLWRTRWSPQWSPDGDDIAVAASDCVGCDWEIQLVAADGSIEPRTISRGTARELSWSPDGEWVAFATGASIWSTSADGRRGGPLHVGGATGIDWRP